MMSAIKELAVGLLASKKFAALVVGLLASLVQIPLIRWAKLPEEQAMSIAGSVSTKIVAAVSAYLIGQGLADQGKEKAKVEAKALAEAKSV